MFNTTQTPFPSKPFNYGVGEPYQRIIIDINPHGRFFHAGLEAILRHLKTITPQLNETNEAFEANLSAWARQVYHEAAFQIFETITNDFENLARTMKIGMDVSRFVNGQVFIDNPLAAKKLHEIFSEFALGIFFALHNNGIFNIGMNFILDQPEIDYVVILMSD
jgi:hypothetical protein